MSLLQKIALDLSKFRAIDATYSRTTAQPPFQIAELIGQIRTFGVDTINLRMADISDEPAFSHCGFTDWQLVCELPVCPDDCPDVQAWVWEQVISAMAKLQTDQLHAVLVSGPTDLAGHRGAELVQALQMIRYGGLSRKIGICVQRPGQLPDLMELHPLDIVKVSDLSNSRFEGSQWAQQMASNGIEIYAASIDKLFGRYREPMLIPNGAIPIEKYLSDMFAPSHVSRVLMGIDNLAHVVQAQSTPRTP